MRRNDWDDERRLAQVATGVAAVAIVSDAVPAVEFVGGAEKSLYRPNEVVVVASASVSGCEGVVLTTARLAYVWRVVELPALASSSVDPRQFKVPPDTLEAGATYAIECTVVDSNGLNNTAVATLNVGRSALVAVVTNGDAVLMGSTEAVVLDGSQSSDPDDAEGAGALAYAWACVPVDGADACELAGDAATLLVDAAALEAGASYELTLTVSDAATGRSAEAAILVGISANAAVPAVQAGLLVSATKVNPSLAVTLLGTVDPYGAALDLAWSLESGELNGGAALDAAALTATTSALAADAAGTVYLKLAAGTLVPGSTYGFRLAAVDAEAALEGYAVLNVLVNAAPTSGYMSVDPAVGFGAGRGLETTSKAPLSVVVHSFRLSVRRAIIARSGGSKLKMFSWFRNARARRGRVEATSRRPFPAQVGFTLETSFALSAVGWVDDLEDLPLVYKFYYAVAPDETEYQLKVTVESEISALLPVGAKGAGDVVRTLCYVADQLDAQALAEVDAQVTQREMSAEALANVTGNLLDSAFETGDLETVYQALNSAGSLKAAAPEVECTANCRSLGRKKCSPEAPDACGDCVSELVGAKGPSLSQCRQPAKTEDCKGRCGGSCAPCPVGRPCRRDGDCLYEICGAATDTCLAPNKTCAADCHGRGTCELLDKADGFSVLGRGESCSIFDDWCATRCECDAGFGGKHCELDAAEYEKTLDLTSSMVDALSQVSASQDADATSGNQASSTLALLASSPCDLDASGSMGSAFATAGGLARSAADVGLVDGTASSLINAMSSFVDSGTCSASSALRRGRRLTAARRLQEMADVLGPGTDKLAEAMLLAAVPGEQASTVSADNVKLASARVDPTARGSAVAAPLSDSDRRAGVTAPQMSLPRTGLDLGENDTKVDIQVTQYGANFHADAARRRRRRRRLDDGSFADADADANGNENATDDDGDGGAAAVSFTSVPVRGAVYAGSGATRRRLATLATGGTVDADNSYVFVLNRAGKGCENPNFKGSYLGRFPLVSADFWTSDHLSERSRSVNVCFGTRARGTPMLKRR